VYVVRKAGEMVPDVIVAALPSASPLIRAMSASSPGAGLR
jgi:hypothetical protein